MLSCSNSDRVMIVDTITDSVDDNGIKMLDITGKSMENVFNDRTAMPALADLTTTPKWVLGPDTPGNIMRTIFQDICVTCVLNANDSIPFYQSGTVTPAGNIAEPTETVTVTLDPGSVYAAFQTIATTYNLGFRLVRHKRTSGLPQVYFEVYTGSDRTSDQTTLPAVIFAEDLDNLTNKSVLKSTAAYKTVAYVFAQNGAEMVYAVNADTTASGFDRKVLYVDASDIDTAAGTDLTAQLTQKGLEALAAQQRVYSFDGQIPEYGGYQYRVDYNLGDLVEEVDSTGGGNFMRVTEQIFTSDNTGEKSYPTLSVDQAVVPGTWAAFDNTEHWADVPTTSVWGNQ